MASNFGITVDKNSGGPGLKSAGDFDGTSAYELIYAIKKLPEDTLNIYVCTNGLKKKERKHHADNIDTPGY
jgi:hypothetical protein